MNQKKELLKELDSYVKKYGDDIFFGSELNFIADRLRSIESSIAVVGQFSVGKSALLNALLGEELLATRKVESTKILTRIRHCETLNDAKVILSLKHGEQKALPIRDAQSLQKYTTFQGEEITDTLEFVDVYWPVHFLNKELVLIDTPGANSLTASAFQTTRKQLKTSSAIIYLFMGTKGLDKEDYTLIEEYTSQQKKVFLVGTHIDQLTVEQWQEVESEVLKKIQRMDALKNVEIVGISSVEALTAKKESNSALLEQSNIHQLEKMLHTYMETKEYENAEVRSIEHDFQVLLNEIKSFEKQQYEHQESAEQDRLRRLERLKVITELEYAEVERLGLQLLKNRTSHIGELTNKYEEKLLTTGNHIFKSVQGQFEKVMRTIKQQMQVSRNVEALKREYVQHLNDVEKIYLLWDTELQGNGQSFVTELEKNVQKQDAEFMDMLKKLETNVKISWDEFDLIMKKIKLKPVQISADIKDFDQYNEKVSEANKKQQQVKKNLANKKQEYEQIKSVKQQRVSSVENAEHQAKQRLGQKPQPRAQYRTKGILFWKREEFAGYDYSDQERWDKEMVEIRKRFEIERREIERKYAAQLNTATQQKQLIESQLYELEAAEEVYELELLGALYTTVNNQASIAKKIHTDRLNDMKSEWKHLVSMQEERYDKHVETIEESYKQFVTKAKKQAISTLKVL